MARPIHLEIHAADPARAQHFYEAVFGWKFAQWPGGPQDYWLITTGPDEARGINGGLFRRRGDEPADRQPANAYVCTVGSVDDVDATVSTVIALGGTLAVPRVAIPGIGWLAYVKDTAGNILGVMKDDPAAN